MIIQVNVKRVQDLIGHFLMIEVNIDLYHNNLENQSYDYFAEYFMTEVGDLAKSICDGRVLVTSCSGLAVVSKFPFKKIQFKEYTWKGNEFKIPPDGEYFAGKGLGRVRIEPYQNMTLDIFVTHTCAMDDNAYYREKQVTCIGVLGIQLF